MERCEYLLLRLEAEPNDEEVRYALFRVFRALKGSATSAGLKKLAARFQEAETLLGDIREGKYELDAEVIEQFFQLPDALAATVAAARGAVLDGSQPASSAGASSAPPTQPPPDHDEALAASPADTGAEPEPPTPKSRD